MNPETVRAAREKYGFDTKVLVPALAIVSSFAHSFEACWTAQNELEDLATHHRTTVTELVQKYATPNGLRT